MINIINAFSSAQKKLVVYILDVIFSIIATFIAIMIIRQGVNNPVLININIYSILIFNFSIIYFVFGLYKQVFRYFNFKNIINILTGSFTYFFINIILDQFINFPFYGKIFISFQSLLFFTMVLISRLAYIYLMSNQNSKNEFNKIFIYGINKNSVNLSNLLNSSSNNKVIYFIEDEKDYDNRTINTIPIKRSKSIDVLIKNSKPDEIIISDKYELEERRKIIKLLEKYNLRIRSVPDLENISKNYFKNSLSKALSLDDLVDRNPVSSIKTNYSFREKIVLVSGAGGSIGSEIVRQICEFNCKKKILIDNSEFNLYSISKEITEFIEKNRFDIDAISILVSVKDESKIDEIFATHKPDFVYHAAAYKHVFLLENNVQEAIENNFFGTINLVNASIKNKVSNFCFISTDKAVNPKTIMGSSKRLAELYIQSIHSHLYKKNDIKTIFSIVRFGNVFNSSGSVIPLFNKQINSGGPLTVTSKNVERYFMSISEAVNLVLQSTELSTNCSIFVLDMGSPLKIIDLAKKLVTLSGLSVKSVDNPEGDIEIKITGISSYEKITEELSINKNLVQTKNSSIFEDSLEIIEYEKLSYLKNEFINNLKEKNINKLKKLINKF